MVVRAIPRLTAVVAAITATAALTVFGPPVTPAHAAASALPRLNITADYVAGVSSGGFMATQLQVAYSSTFDGAGLMAAGPYDCGQGNVVDFMTCDIGSSLPSLEQQAQSWSDQGLIDPIGDLANKPIYTYHGTADPVVNAAVSNAGVAFYQHFGANVEYHDSDPAGHAWVTPYGPLACSVTSTPFMNNCGDDPEGEMLTHWFGGVNAPNTGTATGKLASYDQNQYAPGGNAIALGMDNTSQLYVPASCATGAACKLLVALHGCLSDQTYLGEEFAQLGNLDTYADTNHLVVLYPQTIPSSVPYDPEGCWDWWGYDGPNFAVRSAPQMVTIVNMVHALGG